ncbi:MAG: hypothetical protein ISN28_00825 [Ectothiorhodospiraceae bacterium AqS1]|nr:hypothetical protein [Ectothiorhodospiraceae bacterium AqS1]
MMPNCFDSRDAFAQDVPHVEDRQPLVQMNLADLEDGAVFHRVDLPAALALIMFFSSLPNAALLALAPRTGGLSIFPKPLLDERPCLRLHRETARKTDVYQGRRAFSSQRSWLILRLDDLASHGIKIHCEYFSV